MALIAVGRWITGAEAEMGTSAEGGIVAGV